jgi:hypothetical protein
VSGAVGSSTITLTLSEPIICNQAGATTAWTYDVNDVTLSEGNAAIKHLAGISFSSVLSEESCHVDSVE